MRRPKIYATTAKSIIEMLNDWLDKRSDSPYRDKPFNKRQFEPFHIYAEDYNPNNISKITQEVYDYYIQKPECLTCTGEYDPKPMPCYKIEDGCKMHFRYRNNPKIKGPFEHEGIVETRVNKKNPLSLRIGRDLLIYNYHFRDQLECIVRTARFTNCFLHHINGHHFDDFPGNHSMLLAQLHSLYHTFSMSLIQTSPVNGPAWFMVINEFSRMVAKSYAI
jgi:hypothetical protein